MTLNDFKCSKTRITDIAGANFPLHAFASLPITVAATSKPFTSAPVRIILRASRNNLEEASSLLAAALLTVAKSL